MQADDAGLSVGEAARTLGISVPAVRKRIRRGTLRAYKVDGRWRVIVPAGPEPGSDAGSPEAVRIGEAIGQAALIAQLRSENDYLRRIPELPAGSPPPAPAAEDSPEGTPAPPQGYVDEHGVRRRRPWWARWLRGKE